MRIPSLGVFMKMFQKPIFWSVCATSCLSEAGMVCIECRERAIDRFPGKPKERRIGRNTAVDESHAEPTAFTIPRRSKLEPTLA